MWSENALHPVKSPFSAYLIEPCAQEKEKKENKGQSDMGENNGANRKFPQYLLVKQETSPLCHVQKSQTQQRLICHVRAE